MAGESFAFTLVPGANPLRQSFLGKPALFPSTFAPSLTINLFTQPSLHITIPRLLLDDNNHPWLALLILFEGMGWLGLREL
jgi:hypothetical protein